MIQQDTGLENLLTEIRHCDICREHLPLGPRPVLQASTKAKLLIVGQAPGTKVHKTGIPFNDPSGERLRSWMGISRDIFYDETQVAIIPMGFCYPGRGKSGDLPPRPECAATWRSDLLSRLENIELTLVIGQYALAYHLPELKQAKQTLTETVQSWNFETNPEILPLPHPSPRNNIWLKRNLWFEEDIVPKLRKRVSSLLLGQEL